MKDAVVVISGGMDSATLAYYMQELGIRPHGISFDYGQRHAKELLFARDLPVLIDHEVVDITNLNSLLAGSSLTSDIDVPDGHYAEETMKATVVPNRNMIMTSIALGYCVSRKLDGGVWLGVHAGDHFVYPDCRPPFYNAMNVAAKVGNEGFSSWVGDAVHTPFIQMSKADIVSAGDLLKVPYDQTWSCYKGGEIHCGRCGTCVERKEAFRLANVKDPTVYQDAEFEIAANQ